MMCHPRSVIWPETRHFETLHHPGSVIVARKVPFKQVY